MTTECEHTFRTHYGIQVFNNTGMAWVQWSLIEPKIEDRQDLPAMQICVHCGEQGYEVPA